jgi:hypothetical protein
VAVQVTRRADVQLEVGGVGEQVSISADATPLQTESPVQQRNVTEQQVKELPLEVTSEAAGRTPLSFIFLDSSVTSATTGTNGVNASRFKINGGQALGTEILIDGASTRRTQNGTFFSEVAPGPNAFQEFTVSTSSYSAEFGNSSGGIVNFTLKSGGNEFHGEVYDLVKNEDLNANSFRSNANNLQRDRDNENDFGFNIGGPIYLPHFGEGGPIVRSLKNRAFFFFNYEGYRFTQGENVIVTVPTARMRMGDFGELLTDPYVLQTLGGPIRIYDPRQPSNVRVAIPNNNLATYLGGTRIDPAGFNILQGFPLPNRPGVYHNYVASSLAPITMNQSTFKLDFVLTEKQRLAFSYSHRNQPRVQGGFPRFPAPFVAQNVWNQIFISDFARIQHDYTISPTWLNHFNFGFTRYDVSNMNFADGFNTASLGLPVNATQNSAFPRIDFPGYGDPVSSGDPRAYQNIGSTFFTDRIRDTSFELTDFATHVWGRQTIKFGATFRMSRFNVHQRIDPGGSFNFRNDQTASDTDPGGGWPIASLITGATEFSFNSTNSIDPAFKQLSQSYFFQDDIKVTQRLTLNVGVRYDLPGLRSERFDRFRTFDPTVANPAVGGRPGAIVGAGGQGGLAAQFKTLSKPDRSNFGPRLGFAYSFNDKTVIRGGVGIYYAPILYGFEGNNDINTGTLGYNTNSGPRTPNGRNANFFLSTYPSIPPVDPGGQFIGGDVQYFDPNFKTGRTIQWSLDVQRELPFKLVAQASYIGHKATRLRSNFGRLNALPLDALKLGFPLLNKPLSAVTPAERAYATSVGFTLPASNAAVFPGFDGTVAQSLRPFPQYNRINNLLESQGTSDYNALQLKLDRRFAQGFQFGVSYTFSKLLTDAAEDLFGGSPIGGVLQNPFDRSSLRSVSSNNPRHVIVFNYLIELPFGKGKRFLNRGGIVDKLVGGFEFNGIQRYQSGLPLNLFTSDNVQFLDLIGYNGNLRLNATGQPLDPTNTAFIPVRLGQYAFNPAAFAPPPNYQAPPTADVTDPAYRAYYANPARFFGTVAPVTDAVRGPSYLNEDLSLLKKTHLTERLTLELRAEAFNVFNRKRFFSPTTDFRDAVNFGFQSVGDRNVYLPRRIQLGVRVIF